MSSSPVQEGDILADKYRVESILGEGGMGVVVAAWHQELEKRVAVKFLLREMAERSDAAERFRREARAAVRIQSEHVARVLDVGTMADGVPYMVMEYLDGHDIARELSDRGQLPASEAVDYLLQAGEAVAEAHANGIVHRDLKPANLFLSRRADGSRLVKVLDFGISKSLVGGSLADMSLTRTASMIGSPLYMSPEQMKSAKDVDTRTDVWALGAILFEMLAGRPPFLAETVPQLCAVLLHEAAPPMSDFRSDVPPQLEEAVRRCLEKDRTHRWATVADLAQAIAPFGPPEARIHAGRASRVLGTTDITITDSEPPTLATGSPVSPATAESTPQAKSGSSPAATELSESVGATVDTWGRTDAPAPPRPRWLLPLGAAALVLGSVGVMLLVESPAATAQSGAASASKPAAVHSAAAPAQPSAAEPAPPAVPAAASAAADAGASPSASASAEPPASEKPAAAQKRPVARPRPRVEKPHKGVIPDFGGRR